MSNTKAEQISLLRKEIEVRVERLSHAVRKEAQGSRPGLSDFRDLVDLADLERLESLLSA